MSSETLDLLIQATTVFVPATAAFIIYYYQHLKKTYIQRINYISYELHPKSEDQPPEKKVIFEALYSADLMQVGEGKRVQQNEIYKQGNTIFITKKGSKGQTVRVVPLDRVQDYTPK